MSTLAILRFTTHHARVKISDQGYIQCFKYTNSQCDMACFHEYEQEAAGEYIIEPLPTIIYQVLVSD